MKVYKWFLLLLLSGAFFFHQADRALFGLLTIPIQRELGLTDVEIGWINTVLSWTLALMALIAGPIADRLSRKWLITVSLMAWSLMTFMMGFVGDWTIFGFVIPAFFVVMFFRSIATGVGESFYGPCYPPLIATYHDATRSIALSIHQGALYFGLMTSGVLTAWALGVFGTWRHVFMAFGAGGFVLGVLFIFVLKDAQTPAAPDDAVRPSFFAGMVYFFKTPSAWLAMMGFIAIVFVNNAYLFWAPKFMAEKFSISVAQAGTATMLYHHLCAFVAILLGGVVTDLCVRTCPRFRLAFQIVAMLLGAPAILLIGISPSVASTVVATAAYGVFRGFFEVNTHASLFDVVPPAYRSTAVGLFTVFAFFVGGLSGVLMGALSARFGVRGFEWGFALMACTYLLGALALFVSWRFTFRRDRIAA